MDGICESIEALLIIHNILMELGDNAEDLEGYNPNIDLVGAEEVMVEMAVQRQMRRPADDFVHAAGLYRRRELVNWVAEQGFIA